MGYIPGIDFYVPRHKFEYVNFFVSKYPSAKRNTFNRMTLERLRAIYFAIRTRRKD